MFRLHKREVLTFSEWLVLQKSKETFSESESTSRRHTVFEHLDEIPFRHHGLIVSCSEELLLYLKSSSLIERVIEF